MCKGILRMKSNEIYERLKETLVEIEAQNQAPITDDDWRVLKANLSWVDVDNNKYDSYQQYQLDEIKKLLENLSKQYPLQDCIDTLHNFNEFVIERHRLKLAINSST